VVDANALVGGRLPPGTGARALAGELRVVSTAEVLAEVRDADSRAALAALPFDVEALAPAEASVAAVRAFAAKTGDLHALSRADVGLLALAPDLEARAHGTAHLAAEPRRRTVARRRKGPRRGPRMAGWGDTSEKWREVDEAGEGEGLGQGGDSRIAAALHALNVSEAAAAQPVEWVAQRVGQAGPARAAGAAGGGAGGGREEGEAWEQVTTGRARRRRQRKQGKESEREVAEAEEALRAERRKQLERETGAGGAGGAGEAAETGEAAEAGEADEGTSDDDEHGETDTPELPEVTVESSVSTLTGDFPMQNVMLQMGLKLLAPDGQRVQELHQWSLRCEACGFVTKQMGRVFCPQCGNMNTLKRVQVEVDDEGVEHVVGRARPILRGSKYSLPKPTGGRNAAQRILREDMLPRRMARGKKKVDDFDAFAPEFGEDTWHQHQAVNQKLGLKGAALVTAPHRNNPNERKGGTRSNRRKK